jgi:glycosyltransferase involved in cell wall biosynthesis
MSSPGMITQRHKEAAAGQKFSILIPSWNNLPYLKLCIRSIRQNSDFPHQVIVHINEGSDGSLAWVRENGLSYTHSGQNIGVCWAMNALRPMADSDYLVFMNDDMYVCPGWDTALADEIASAGTDYFCLSSTLIQPRRFWCKSVISPVNFGEDAEHFDEEGLLKHYMDMPHGDWSGSTWPPVVVHRDIWDLAGGYSVEYSPGLYSDPDFSAKLYLAGVRHFKGINRSRVYHFEARSTGRVRKNRGSRQFLRKWGLTSSTFMKYILHRGEPFGNHRIPRMKLWLALAKSRIKLMWASAFSAGQPKNLWENGD